jgi:hypothetical protein
VGRAIWSPTLRGDSLTIHDVGAYRAKAAHCSTQSKLTEDERLKKYWEEMAGHWLALAGVITAKDGYEHPPKV